MQHPSQILIPEYRALLPSTQIVASRQYEVDAVAARLLRLLDAGKYADVCQVTGIPFLFVGPSFEREAGSNFTLSPAQGDPLDRPSTHVPINRGPFATWRDAALDAYAIDGLDKVGAANWSYELVCYYGEAFNGFGYRDYHATRTPYLWGATNLQQPGKYVADGSFRADEDKQLGVVAMLMRLGEMRPSLRLATEPWPFAEAGTTPPAPRAAPPATTGLIDAFGLQRDLNALGYGPLLVDGNYGAQTARAVKVFQSASGIEVDGVAGPKTDAALRAALAASSAGG